jgi:hypothetical protein
MMEQWRGEDQQWHEKQAARQSAESSSESSTPKISGSDITDADRAQYGGAITISANVLYHAYDANEVAADEKYKGKSVKITGKVQSIGKDILGSPYVVIGGSGMLDGVQCVFATSETSPLASLSKGQTVTISGTVSGKMVQPMVSDCKLLNATWFPSGSKTH